MARKSWLQPESNQALLFSGLALLVGADLVKELHGHKVVWLEIAKLTILVALFVQRLLLARKHPEQKDRIFEPVSWAALFSGMTDVFWTIYLTS